jgi:hypothetical protein
VFPDWDADFHLVDDVLAGFEGFAAVGGGDFDPEGGLVDGDVADAVDESDGFDGPARGDFGEDVFELAAGHGFESFVVDAGNFLVAFGGAHDALERDDGAGVHRNFAARGEGGFVDFGAGDLEINLHPRSASLDGREERDFVAVFQNVGWGGVFEADGDKGGARRGSEFGETFVNALHELADGGGVREFLRR